MKAALCRYCGVPVKKHTRTVYLRDRDLQPHEKAVGSYARYLRVESLPKTLAECRKLTNQHVVSVKKHHERQGIASFGEWDGKSYVDEFFCNGAHAKLFGYAAARSGHVMAAWQQAAAKQEAKLSS